MKARKSKKGEGYKVDEFLEKVKVDSFVDNFRVFRKVGGGEGYRLTNF